MKVRIGGDATQFRQTLAGVKGEAAKAGKSIAGAISSPLGLALGGSGLAAGLIALGKSAIDAADDVDKGSQKIQVSAETYQRLAQMANFAGSSIEQLVPAFGRMSRVIAGADEESITAQKSLWRIGLTLDDLKGKKPEDQFALIAKRLSSVSDEAARSAAAQEIFGRGGVELLPLIKNYEELARQVEDMPVMSDENVAAAARYKDALDAIGQSIQSNLINSGLIQWLADAAEGMAKLNKPNANVTDVGGSYRKSGFFRNLADSVLPEGGAQFTVGITPEEQAKLDADRKRRRASGKTYGEEKKEKEIVRKNLVAEMEAKAKAEKEAEAARKKAEAEAEREKERKAKAREVAADTVADMEHQVKIQKMINDGKEREATIEDAIYRAKERSSEITDEELKKVGEKAGELYDLTKKDKKDKDPKTPDNEPQVTALERIGAIFGGMGNKEGTRELKSIASYTKKTNSLLEKIADKTNESTLGAV